MQKRYEAPKYGIWADYLEFCSEAVSLSKLFIFESFDKVKFKHLKFKQI